MLELPSGRQSLTKAFERFFHSEKAGGIVLIVCTSISLVVANSSAGPFYLNMWQTQMPAFALANTAIIINTDWMAHIASSNSIGIIAGLVLGKPIGLTLFCLTGVAMGICRIPTDLSWQYISGAGILGGIGFTMSIFIANLAFGNNAEAINASKIAILCASISAGVGGYLWLRIASGDRSGNSHLQRRSEAKAHAKE